MRAKRRYTVILAQFTRDLSVWRRQRPFWAAVKCRNHCCGKQSERISLPRNEAVQSTAAPDPSSLDWEHLILAEKPCEDPEYAGVGRSAVAYVDGSYQHALGKFSCGVVLFLDGKELNLAEEYSDPDLVSMRNVAGEIKGAELAMAYCLTHDIPELAIYHDYQGIASWCTREWQAKKQGTIDYRNFYDLASAKVAIRFCKVKGHTGVTYNEKADQLAKQALGL